MISHHALKNALIPVVTIMAIQVAGLLSGAVITEAVFGIPGIGRLSVSAIQARDMPLLQGSVLFATALVILGNLVADILYSVLDPRVRSHLRQGQEVSLSPTALTEPVALEEIRAASLLRDAVAAFRRNHLAMAGLLFVLLLALLAIFAPLVSPYNPYIVDLDNSLLPPSLHHWLGTDNFGRDVLTRILYGARISLVVGLVPSFIALVIGTAMGIFSGYVGGRTDFVVMRLADMMIAFPSLLLAMVVMYTLGANLFNIFIALAPRRLGRGGAGGAGADPGAEGEGIHRGRARQRHLAADDHGPSHLPQCGADLDRAVLALHSRCDHVGIEPQLPRRRGPAAGSELGAAWCRPARTICSRRRWSPWRRGWRS